ncbi:FUSC family membrane protein [Rapidithrix thailandica]|uniref:FUSC family membrane protein n=1 Tax=Rapidithrix thailandica TaxID=413964 RepID=A0AAW9S8A6_9BACT
MKNTLQYLTQARDFLRTEDFATAFRYALGMFLPFVIMRSLGQDSLAIELMLGASFVSGVDLPGSWKHKTRLMLTSNMLATVLTIVILLIIPYFPLLIGFLFIAIFCLAYFASYGHEQAILAFMGYLAIMIALSSNASFQTPEAILGHSFRIFCGGIWYLAYALILFKISGKRVITRRVAQCLLLTAQYFEQRIALYEGRDDTKDVMFKLATLQSELQEMHDVLRHLLLKEPGRLVKADSLQRKMLLVFIELVEMLETAIAAPIDYDFLNKYLSRYRELVVVQQVVQVLVSDMYQLGNALFKGRRYLENTEITQVLDLLEENLSLLHEKSKSDPDAEKVYQWLKQVQHYLLHQCEKLGIIQGILSGKLEKPGTYVDESSHHQFVNPNPVNWISLSSNFNFESSFFRYAMRTAVVAVVGYSLAYLLQLTNPYWVLLTVLVVMKPGYSVTRQRFFHRVLGTVIGALVAYLIHLAEPGAMVSLFIFGVAIMLGFAFLSSNYVIASAFFTIYVINLYSFLHRAVEPMLIYRVVDTLIGAVLCLLAVRYLWPFWEKQNLPYFLEQSVSANRAYLLLLQKQFIGQKRGKVTEYRLARKQVFTHMANLINSLQRMLTDPEKKKKQVADYYESVILNYAMMSTASTIGIFLKRNEEERFDLEVLQTLLYAVLNNLNQTMALLKNESGPAELQIEEVTEAQLGNALTELRCKANAELRLGIKGQEYYHYTHVEFLTEQLIRLNALSAEMLKQLAKLSQKEFQIAA